MYRWFCHLGWQDPVPDDTTLVVFRRLLGADGFHRLFNRLIEQSRELGRIQSSWLLIDGTKLTAHVAVKNTLFLVREGRKRILKLVARKDPGKAAEPSQQSAPCADADYPSHSELLAAEQERGHAFLTAVTDCLDPQLAQEGHTYEQILAGEGVASFSDPDALGIQKKKEPFLVYKIHTACTEQGIVTAAAITRGNESELPQLPQLVEAVLQRGHTPHRLAADTSYDSFGIREYLIRKAIRPYIPVKPTGKKSTGFTYDSKHNTMRCPRGKASIGATPHQKGGKIYYFSEKDCVPCPFRISCLGEFSTHKRVYRNEHTTLHRVKGVKHAMRVRKTIERVFADAKTWHRMGRAWYRGLQRLSIQVYLTFMVVNAKKLALRGSPAGC